MGFLGIRKHSGDPGYHGECLSRNFSMKGGLRMFALLASAVSVPLAQFAEGAMLAVSVYLVSRGKERR